MIPPRMRMTRVEKASNQIRFVGKQQKSFRISVQPPDRIDVRWQPIFREGPLALTLRREAGHHTIGFIQSEEHGEEEKEDGDWD